MNADSLRECPNNSKVPQSYNWDTIMTDLSWLNQKQNSESRCHITGKYMAEEFHNRYLRSLQKRQEGEKVKSKNKTQRKTENQPIIKRKKNSQEVNKISNYCRIIPMKSQILELKNKKFLRVY